MYYSIATVLYVLEKTTNIIAEYSVQHQLTIRDIVGCFSLALKALFLCCIILIRVYSVALTKTVTNA